MQATVKWVDVSNQIRMLVVELMYENKAVH